MGEICSHWPRQRRRVLNLAATRPEWNHRRNGGLVIAKLILATVLPVASLSLGSAPGSTPQKTAKQIVWTGWFSDSQCARTRTAEGTFRGINPICNKNCIQKGVAPVFISEQANAIFNVKDYPSVIEDLGYHLEITGTVTVDDAAKTVSIQNVRRLQYDGAACSRPRK
jgi:hypothetical protein